MTEHDPGRDYADLCAALTVATRRVVRPCEPPRADRGVWSHRSYDHNVSRAGDRDRYGIDGANGMDIDADWPAPKNAHTLAALLARLPDPQKAWTALTAAEMIASVWATWAAAEQRPEALAVYTLSRVHRAIAAGPTPTAMPSPLHAATTIILKRSLGELAIDASRMDATQLAGLLPALPGTVVGGEPPPALMPDLRSPIARVRARSAARECLIALEHLVRLALSLYGTADRLDVPTLASFAIQSSAHAAAHAFSPPDAIEVNEIPANGAYGFRFRQSWWGYVAWWYTQWWRVARARLPFVDAASAVLE